MAPTRRLTGTKSRRRRQSPRAAPPNPRACDDAYLSQRRSGGTVQQPRHWLVLRRNFLAGFEAQGDSGASSSAAKMASMQGLNGSRIDGGGLSRWYGFGSGIARISRILRRE